LVVVSGDWCGVAAGLVLLRADEEDDTAAVGGCFLTITSAILN
jgi:hypothetical protein